MSKETFIEFYTKHIFPNEEIKLKLQECKTEDEFMNTIVPIAKKAGYRFNMDDVKETVIGEMTAAIEILKNGNSIKDSRSLKKRKFFNPLAAKILSIGNDMQMGTCHC